MRIEMGLRWDGLGMGGLKGGAVWVWMCNLWDGDERTRRAAWQSGFSHWGLCKISSGMSCT